MAIFKPSTGTPAAGGGAYQYMFDSQSTAGAPSATRINDTPWAAFVSPDPTETMNAWDLPQNSGLLKLPTGITNQVPTSASDLKIITQSIQMIDLYGKLSAGQKLSPVEVTAASELGGDVARAAQMQGSKNGSKAVGEALTEIGVRLKNVGITPEDLGSFKTAKVGPQFSNILQNAGYGVTKNMTFDQMLQETSGPKAQQPLPYMSQGMTIGQYIQGLNNLTKSQISQLQSSLFNAGLYDSQYQDGSKSYTQGVLDNATILAFRNALLQSLNTNKPLEQVIGGQLPVPTTNQATAPPSGSSLPGTASTSYVPQTQQSQLQDPLIKAFESALGRAPSESELAAFTTTYNQEQEAASKYATDNGQSPQTAIDLQTGVPYLETAPTASAASASYAMNSNPVEYQAHGVANAFGMLMNLVDRTGTSALDTPGHSPNVSS